MIITRTEFLLRTRLDQQTLEVWIQEEWLSPAPADPEPLFSEADLARAGLIRDLQGDLVGNKEGVGVILNRVDQIHSRRWALSNRIGSAKTEE